MKEFIEFMSSNPTVYHACDGLSEMMKSISSNPLVESQANWHLEKGKVYHITRNNTSIMAFAIGEKFDPKKGGMAIIAGHLDSLCLKRKDLLWIQTLNNDVSQA